MGSRDRPRRQEKRKPKGGVKAKQQPPAPPAYEPPASVEVIKPRRKPRSEEPRGEE